MVKTDTSTAGGKDSTPGWGTIRSHMPLTLKQNKTKKHFGMKVTDRNGPESLTATPFRNRSSQAVPQVWRAKGSFPPGPTRYSG